MKVRYEESFLFPQSQVDFNRGSINFPQGQLRGLPGPIGALDKLNYADYLLETVRTGLVLGLIQTYQNDLYKESLKTNNSSLRFQAGDCGDIYTYLTSARQHLNSGNKDAAINMVNLAISQAEGGTCPNVVNIFDRAIQQTAAEEQAAADALTTAQRSAIQQANAQAAAQQAAAQQAAAQSAAQQAAAEQAAQQVAAEQAAQLVAANARQAAANQAAAQQAAAQQAAAAQSDAAAKAAAATANAQAIQAVIDAQLAAQQAASQAAAQQAAARTAAEQAAAQQAAQQAAAQQAAAQAAAVAQAQAMQIKQAQEAVAGYVLDASPDFGGQEIIIEKRANGTQTVVAGQGGMSTVDSWLRDKNLTRDMMLRTEAYYKFDAVRKAAAAAAATTQTTKVNTTTGTVQTTDKVNGTTSTVNAATGSVRLTLSDGTTATGAGSVVAGGVITTVDTKTGTVTTQNTTTGVVTQTDATTGKTVTGLQVTGNSGTGGTFMMPDGKTVMTTKPITSTAAPGAVDSGKIALFGLIGLLLLRGAVK
jgi:chemotaxis protein histidine kinase CheA